MWNFGFRKKPSFLQAGLSAKLLRLFYWLQHRWCTYMTKKTGSLSVKKRKLYFIGYCLLFSLANVFVLIQAFTPGKIDNTTLTRPSYHASPAARPEREATLTNTDKQAILSFHHLLDSLSLTPQGRAQVEAFKQTHKGFMDSLAIAEQQLP